MLNNKKGVELTMNMIIIAAIAIIVLIVLIVLFMKGSGGFAATISSCADRNGQCVSSAEECTQSGGGVFRMAKCSDKDQVCCIQNEEATG